MANMVLPQPGPPHTIVGRPFGTPPPVISSKPAIPVLAFCSCGKGRASLLRRDFDLAEFDLAKEVNLQSWDERSLFCRFAHRKRKRKNTLIIHHTFTVVDVAGGKVARLPSKSRLLATGKTLWTAAGWCRRAVTIPHLLSTRPASGNGRVFRRHRSHGKQQCSRRALDVERCNSHTFLQWQGENES